MNRLRKTLSAQKKVTAQIFEQFLYTPDVPCGQPGLGMAALPDAHRHPLFYGGIVYMLILYISFIYFMLYREKKYKYAAVLLLFIVFIVNIKGEIFRSSIVLFLFVYLKLVLQSRLETERA